MINFLSFDLAFTAKDGLENEGCDSIRYYDKLVGKSGHDEKLHLFQILSDGKDDKKIS